MTFILHPYRKGRFTRAERLRKLLSWSRSLADKDRRTKGHVIKPRPITLAKTGDRKP